MRVVEQLIFEKVSDISRIFIIIVLSCLIMIIVCQGKMLPVTENNILYSDRNLKEFLVSAKDRTRVTKVEVPELFSYSVLLLDNNPPEDGVGQYKDATRWNSIGLIAHNYSAGNSFFELSPGMEAKITFSSGETETYILYNVMIFQALDPNNYQSPFISSEGEKIQVKDLIMEAYQPGELTFQTCVAAEGSMTWGLFFAQAKLEK